MMECSIDFESAKTCFHLLLQSPSELHLSLKSKIAQIFLPCQPWFIIARMITPNLHTLPKNYFFYKGKICLCNCVKFTSAMNPNTASKLH
jgi:hypothetical protein